LNIIFFDPTDKPFIYQTSETQEQSEEMKRLRSEGDFDVLKERMSQIRAHDLNLVDRSDFLIAWLDPTIPTCGTYEEIFSANRSKKPIFIICEKGLESIPLWLYGTIPYSYFFVSIDDLIACLNKIDSGEMPYDTDRWRLLRPEFR
jgi:hypothetical protein